MKKNVLVIVGIIIFTILLGHWLSNTYFFKHLELLSYDLRSRYNAKIADKDIVILAIDNESLQELTSQPKGWEKDVWMRVVQFVEKGQPKALMFNMVFEKLEDPPFYRRSFAETIKPYPDIVLGTYVDKPLGAENNFSKKIDISDNANIPTYSPLDVTIDDKKLDKAITYTQSAPIDDFYIRYNTVGVLNSVLDDDSVVRKNQPIFKVVKDGKTYYMPSLAFAGFLKYMGEGGKIVIKNHKIFYKNRVIPIDENGVVNISWHSMGRSYAYIPISKILLNKGEIQPKFFKNKLVIIGKTFTGKDVDLSSLIDSSYTMPEANAVALDNFINDSNPQNKSARKFIHEIPKSIQYVIIAITCLFVALLGLLPKSAFLGFLNGFALIILYVTFSFWMFINPASRIWLPLVEPLYYLTVTAGVVFAFRFYSEMTKKASIMNVFGKFVSPKVLATVMKDPTKLVLKNTKKHITILFCDVKGFTSLSEKYDAEKLVTNLNELFKEIVNIIFENEGTVDKFIGDCVMAYWGDMTSSEENEFLAVKTALEIKQKVDELKIIANGLHNDTTLTPSPQPSPLKGEGAHADDDKIVFDVKIGINTGEAILGLAGTDKIMSYTAMGDAVNVAARLETACSQYEKDILISKATYERIKDKIEALSIGKISIKGKDELVEVYEPINFSSKI